MHIDWTLEQAAQGLWSLLPWRSQKIFWCVPEHPRGAPRRKDLLPGYILCFCGGLLLDLLKNRKSSEVILGRRVGNRVAIINQCLIGTWPHASPWLTGSGAAGRGAGRRRGAVGRRAPLFCLALGLLSRYPDSVLGQLRMSSNRQRLHVCGTGGLFQHAR